MPHLWNRPLAKRHFPSDPGNYSSPIVDVLLYGLGLVAVGLLIAMAFAILSTFRL